MVDAWLLACAAIAALASLVVILRSDVLHSALALVVVLLALAGIYAGLGAYFIAAVQVAVYAGAVMVLFLFAIMVLESRRERPSALSSRRLHRLGALVTCGVLLITLVATRVPRGLKPAADRFAEAPNLSSQASLLFSQYLLPFELVGVLLLVAVIAVMVLARRPEGT